MKTLMILLFSISTSINAEVVETEKMSIVIKRIAEVLKVEKTSEVLVIFDIDNTLLTTNQELGSLGWGTWQKEQIKNDGPYAITDSLQKLYRIENILYTLTGMKQPELGSWSKIEPYIQSGLRVIGLTSRGPGMRSATEKELKANGINLGESSFHVGHPGTYTPSYGVGRKVSFQNGINMTAGQNKGKMLKDLLKRTGNSFSTIIFVDDQKKHCLEIEKELRGSDIKLETFHYTRMSKRVEAFLNSDKKRVIQSWNKLCGMIQSTFSYTSNNSNHSLFKCGRP